ncbi:MAG: InlB B-repeat-containing protein [Clostridia bacterium]|nr:InlB B-repeat-containing protein [Clostridia bacterium]
MKQTKRLISVLLALLMALSAFSVGAFAGGDDTVVKEITVSGSVVPKAGREITTDGIKVSSGVDVDSIQWTIKNSEGNYVHLSSGSFILGTEYTLLVIVTVSSGYTMDPNYKAYVHTEEADTFYQSYVGKYYIAYTYPPLKEETVLSKAAITGVDVPYAEMKAATADAKITKGLTILDIAWYKEGMPGHFNKIAANETFQKGEVYGLGIGFKTDFCYSLPIGSPFEVAGKTVEVEKPVNGVYNIWVEFPAAEYKNVTVTFNAAPGLVSPTTKTVSYGVAYGSLPIPSSSGRKFLGWYDGETKITATSIVTKAEDHVLTAKWQMNNLVTFDPAGGTVDPTSKSYPCGEAFGTLPTPTREGYTFANWVDENNIVVKNTTIVPNQLNMKLTAKWIKNASYINVLFDANGGTVSPTKMTYELGAPYGELPTPTRDGYKFNGWYDAENNLITKDSIVEGLNNKQLTAKWTKKGSGLYINVIFDANGGTVDPAMLTLELDAPYGSLPVPTREGYIFKGWYDAENNLIINETLVAGTNNKKLTAKWEKIPSGHTAHTYDAGVVTKEATCTETGETTYTCTVCGATKVEIIPMTEHTYSYEITPATLKKNGKIVKVCSACGAVAKTSKIRMPQTFTLSATEFTYTGKNKKPTVVVTDTAGKTVASKYFTLTYKNNKNVGRAIVTVTFKGRYSGAKNIAFKINPRPTSLTKVVGGTKMFKAVWKALTTQVTGYQIQYATNKKFTKNASIVTVRDADATAKKITKLKAETKYYVRIRTFHTVGGKNYFSGWSKALAVTTK